MSEHDVPAEPRARNCMACGYIGPASSFRVERGDWEHCPMCRSNDVQEVLTMHKFDPVAGMRADLDVATRAWLEDGAGLIAECSPSISRDWNKLLSRINVMRERNGLDPLPRPDHWPPPNHEIAESLEMSARASGEPSGAEAQYRITGAAIRNRRTAAGMSLRELAAAVGIGADEMGEIERGIRRPDANTVTAIREAINAASGSRSGHAYRCKGCGEWFDDDNGGRHAAHDAGCDGSCRYCPVPCGPIVLYERAAPSASQEAREGEAKCSIHLNVECTAEATDASGEMIGWLEVAEPCTDPFHFRLDGPTGAQQCPRCGSRMKVAPASGEPSGAEAVVREALDALDMAWELLIHAAPNAWANGNTSPTGIDEGEVRTANAISDIDAVLRKHGRLPTAPGAGE